MQNQSQAVSLQNGEYTPVGHRTTRDHNDPMQGKRIRYLQISQPNADNVLNAPRVHEPTVSRLLGLSQVKDTTQRAYDVEG